jgi:hypothetical protein
MNPEIPLDESPADGISRRKVLKRIGAGMAIAWTAPVLTSLKTPAFAQESPCDPGAECNLGMPCNIPIPCKGGNLACNCWVKNDASACFCGGLILCVDLQPCGPGGTCPYGEVCVANCCPNSPLCYAPCSASAAAGSPKAGGPAYGTR